MRLRASFKGSLLAVLLILFVAIPVGARQQSSSLRGRITDAFGAIVIGVTVTITGADGKEKSAVSDAEGAFIFRGLAQGKYLLRAAAPGFEAYESEVDVAPGGGNAHDVGLKVALEKQEITITDEATLDTDPSNNADAIVLRGKDLDVLPDDPDALASAVQAMAGPSAGPNGGQIFIDGFTGGRMPPKESIREVRVNQNPFNAENDQPGFGRVDILTKPGMDKFRGSSFFNFSDESLNSRNPFASTRAPFQVRYYGGSLSGPIVSKKSSFFLDFQKRVVEDNAIINATVLDPSLRVVPFRLALLTPNRNISFSPRFDYQLSPNHTLVARYSYSRTSAENIGASDFSLPERAYERSNTEQTFQITETAVLGPTMINETRFQFIRTRNRQEGNNTLPTIVVLDAFIAGGSQVGLARSNDDRWEFQNYSTLTSGRHIVRFGIRLRGINITDISPQNFGGTFLFSGGTAPELDANDQVILDSSGNPVPVSINSLERFRRTILFQNRGSAEMRALGGGATQFTIASGDPEAQVSRTDLGLYLQDEWRIRPNFTLSFGLRYEWQTNISSNFNFAPRLFFAWAPGGSSVGTGPGAPTGSPQPKMIIRGGMGVFYHRFSERGTLISRRFNGETQTDFRVFDPAVLDVARFSIGGVTNAPGAEALEAFASPQVVRHIADDFQTPYSVMTAINVERQLPAKFTMFALAFNFRSKRLVRTRNVNAPLPGTYDPLVPGSGVRPFGNIGDIYYYESGAKFNDYRFFVGIRRPIAKGLSIFANFGGGKGKTDTDCIFGGFGSCFPADSYDASNEYARVAFIPSHNFFFGGSIVVPKAKLSLNPFVVVSAGRAFNIVTGRDTNGDGIFMERPSFASERTAPENLRRTRFGDFDLDPAPGLALIPRNFGDGPGFVSFNLGINRTFSFGNVPKPAAVPESTPPAQKAPSPTPAKGNSQGGQKGAPANAKPASSPAPEKRYSVTFSLNIQNLFNNTNLNQPIGNLSSPRFGESTATAGGFGGGSSAAGNRRIQAQIRFNF